MFRSEGFTEFVPKPIERTVLERVLRKVLPKSCIQTAVAGQGEILLRDDDHPQSVRQILVLAVDDEERNLVVAKGVLGSYGIEVDTCLSGREAIARCGSSSYDIIFLTSPLADFAVYWMQLLGSTLRNAALMRAYEELCGQIAGI